MGTIRTTARGGITAVRCAIVLCRWLYRAARTLAAMSIAAACIAEDQALHWRRARQDRTQDAPELAAADPARRVPGQPGQQQAAL